MSDPHRHAPFMKVTRRSFARLLGGIFLAPQIAPALESKRLPLAPTIPVRESSDPIAARLLESVTSRKPVPIFYQGGETPGALRRFAPTALYRLSPGGPILAIGHCQRRRSTRTLRIDRIRLA